MKISHYASVMFGADPELFLSKDGQVIGAEKVLPKEGIRLRNLQTDELEGKPVVIIDGVQAELNPVPSHCRQVFSNNLAICFQKLAEQMAKHGDIKADFASTVEVSKQEMLSLDKSSQQFGCAPSKNAYKDSEIRIKDASKYYKRSAGGHIHIGHQNIPALVQLFTEKHKEVAQMLDILVGNTCVLLDRDEGNIERRKVYGRAGEYRLPPHGFEYRTLSNFWLRSYQLTSFVLAMTRFAVSVAMDKDAPAQILACVDMEKIQKAINENSFELAYENFNAIKDMVSSITYQEHSDLIYPLQGVRMEQFETIVKNGIDHYFKEDPMEHWVKHNYKNERVGGWENFLVRHVPVQKKEYIPVLVIDDGEELEDEYSEF